jgi:hypothetical protein
VTEINIPRGFVADTKNPPSKDKFIVLYCEGDLHQRQERLNDRQKLKVSVQRDLVTVVGNLIAPTHEEIIRVQADWVNHPKYTEQLKLI